MPLAPATPLGSVRVSRYSGYVLAAAAGADVTTEIGVIGKRGYISAARYLPSATRNGANTDSRTLTIVDPTTHAYTDGNIVDPANFQGVWASATAYTSGQVVIFNNLMWVCIANVTGGTGPGVDTSHWSPIAAMGLDTVNSITAAFSSDDLAKTITDSGNTDIPASSSIGSVLSAPGVTAAKLVNSSGVAVNGTAVIGRTVTVGASRTLATLALVSGVNLAAGVEKAITLSTTDTAVYPGDVLQCVSTHVGSTGLAGDAATIQVEVTHYGE